jgi:sRNA-binding protein
MKKWMYVLAPGTMLAVFLFFYFESKAETDAREKAHQEEVAKEKADADAKKQLAEAKAREDAQRREAQREKEEKDSAQAKLDKYEANMHRIQTDTDASNARAEARAKEVSELTIEIENLQKQKDDLSHQSFDDQKKIQLAEVARENAEFEIQRLVQMIADRADQSGMAKGPPEPAPGKDNS